LNLHEWNKFYIDLSPIVAKDKGALYQVELKFKKEYSTYGCADSENSSASIQKIKTTNSTEWTEAGWDSYDYWYDYDYYDYYDEDYDYNRWDDPCNAAYYSGKNVKSNILASDIGIVAKAGGDKIMHVFLNDILTTNPIPQATVEFYNYQQELIGSHQTNDDGMCEAYLDEKPFVVIAKNGEQRGYLKLRDGESLSLSKFDVSGGAVQNGVKGMIYTERGVWRPGDSIYIAFMLEDKNNILPKNHPVTFKLYNPQNQLVDKQILSSGLNGLFDFRTATHQDDVTGNYLQYKANAIGENDAKIREKLKDKYTEKLTVKEGIKLALDIFKEIQKEDYSIERFDAGILEKGKELKKLSGKSIESY
jgi:hypothetical protein